MIDNLNVDDLESQLTWLLNTKEKHDGITPQEREFFMSLFDKDLILTIKDRLQAPTYHRFAFTESQIKSWFEEAGYQEIQRITRYTKHFRNLRRFLAPLYYHYDHPLARLLFGEGYIQMIGKRVL